MTTSIIDPNAQDAVEIPENIKLVIQQMVRDQVKQQVADKMEVFKAQYKKEMRTKLNKMVAAETIKQQKQHTENNDSQVKGNKIPAKVMKVMGSPRSKKVDLNKHPNVPSLQIPSSISAQGSPRPAVKDKNSMKAKMAQTQRSPERPSTSQKFISSKSPTKNYADRFKKQSAEQDIVDPIYENKDPIGDSFTARKDMGGILMVKKVPNQSQFFFNMQLNGSGLQINDADKVKAIEMSPVRKGKKKDLELLQSPKGKKQAKMADPIADSIKQRKDYGSYLSVIVSKEKVIQSDDGYLFAVSGKGIQTSDLKKPVSEMQKLTEGVHPSTGKIQSTKR